ncbi:MAG: 4Fe-4S dicluster domain-containing protein, partial [Clostridia bacterium]
VTKLCGGILALPVEHPLLHKALLPPQHVRNRARSVCIQCRTCTDLCPRYLAGHPIYPHLSMRAFAMGETLEKSAALCMDCGVCDLYACP